MQSLKLSDATLSDVTQAFEPALPAATQKRTGAAKDFEALLIGQMLKTVREEQESDDPAADTAMGLGDEEFARAIAAAGGLGLAKTIEAGLR